MKKIFIATMSFLAFCTGHAQNLNLTLQIDSSISPDFYDWQENLNYISLDVTNTLYDSLEVRFITTLSDSSGQILFHTDTDIKFDTLRLFDTTLSFGSFCPAFFTYVNEKLYDMLDSLTYLDNQ